LHVPPVFDVRLLARRSVVYRNNSGYDLTIDHLRTDRRYVVERCRISEADDFSRREKTVYEGGTIHLRNELPPPGVELITIHAVDALPEDAAPQTAETVTAAPGPPASRPPCGAQTNPLAAK
jgi:hypothetical protein